MSDSTLLRAIAGTGFRRADTRRDERAADPLRPFEDFLVDVAGLRGPAAAAAASIARLDRAVAAAAEPLAGLADARIAERHAAAVRRLTAGGAVAATARDDAPLAAVLACIAVASRRRLGLWPHAVQFAGARALLAGELAEMPTGEGKTLVAAIAATAIAASGAAVHVLTTNDYLAQRDRDEMSALFDFFGLSAGCVQAAMSADARRRAYAHPICYASGKEVVFDYLKDRVAGHGLLPTRVARVRDLAGDTAAPRPQPLIPALHYAIVDEADSVLIDEARTPMILSQDAPPVFDAALLRWAIDAARRLQPGRHFSLGASRDVDLLPGAVDAAPPLPPGVRAVWRSPAWRALVLRQALAAQYLYVRDQHYIVVDDKVQIVDESTGRVMPDRSWEQGLHQLIETKESVPVTKGRETLARMTYQRFFRRYYLVAGLTGTAVEASRELWSVYRLRVRRIPPERPNRRHRLPDRCAAGLAGKWAFVADDVVAATARGQPVLVGTRSVQASEQVAAELARRGIDHVVLNARQDADEAMVVSQAGRAGRVTVATNMAGRGTDIKPDADAIAAGGLHVILTEFHESPRVDRQLFGRSARQGEPGSVRAIVSADDPLFEKQPAVLRALLGMLGGTLGGAPQRLLLRALKRRAQAVAERRARRVRLQTLKHDKELHRMIGYAGPVR